jgi:hypothetical protein
MMMRMKQSRMKQSLLRSALAVSVGTALAAAPASIHAQASPASSNASRQSAAGITIPVTGTAADAAGAAAGTFTGTFHVREFAARGDQVFALGLVTGTLTPAAGAPTGVARTVAVPVRVGEGPAPSGVVAQQVCDILHLELGPLNLDLLGLVVNLNRVILDIDAVAGPGNLLGNLLCAVVGLLDSPGPLAQLLNRILAIIS